MPRTPLVVDASIFIAFAAAGRFPLLKKILSPIYEVYTTQLVYDEVVTAASRDDAGRDELRRAVRTWVTLRNPRHLIAKRALVSRVSQADRSVVSLALELSARLGADERDLRNSAARLGIEPIGSLGILAAAVSDRVLTSDEAVATGEALRAAGFRIAHSLFEWWRRNLESR